MSIEHSAVQVLGEMSLGATLTRARDKLGIYLQNPREQMLREHQVNVMKALHDFLGKGETAGYISLPTGSGKTVIITELAQALGLRTLVLSPTRTILRQTHRTAQQFTPDVSVTNFYSGEKNTAGDVLNATYQSVPALLRNGHPRPEDIELVICDEAHTALGEQRHTLFRQFPNALMIGLTATPYFTPIEGYKTRGIVDPTEPWTKMFSERIHEMSLEEAMERGVLTELDVHLVRTNSQVKDITITSLGEYRRSDVERVFNTEARNYLAIGMLAGVDKIPPHVDVPAAQREEIRKIHELIKGKKTAIFGLSIDHIEDLAVKLGTAGVSTMAVHSKLEERARQARFNLYDQGHIQVLLGVDLLRLGWDSPSTEVGIFLAPTRSGIVAVQELGRILRPSPETGKQRAVAIQLVDEFRQRSQAPILIMDIFNPDDILRGTQTGLRAHEQSELRPQARPVVTFSGMHIDSIFEEARTRYLLQKRFKTADVMEMDHIMDTLLADIQGKNPDADPVKLYQLFAKELPYFISSRNQLEAMQATANIDSNVSRAGTRVSILINMKTIMSATEPYLSGDPDKDGDLIQAGIANLMVGIAKIRAGNGVSSITTTYIHGLVRNSIAQEIARRDGVPVGWVRDKLDAKVVGKVEQAFAENPNGLSGRQIMDLADQISVKTGVPSNSVEAFIKYRNSLVQDDEIRDEEDLVDAASQQFLREKLNEALGKLNEHRATVLKARFGLLDGQEHTLDEVSKLVDVSRERAQQIEWKSLRNLRARPYSTALRPYLYPEDYTRAIRKRPETPKVEKQESPKVEAPVNYSALLGVPVRESRLKYRYPKMSLRWGTGLDKDVIEALYKGKVYVVAQLLSKSDQELLAIGGIGTEQLDTIKSTMRRFLEEDAKVVTIGDRMFGVAAAKQEPSSSLDPELLSYGVSATRDYLRSLGLSPRTTNILYRSDMTLKTLANLTDQEILEIRQLGQKGLEEIRQFFPNP